MASITIRNLDAHTKARLRVRAALEENDTAQVIVLDTNVVSELMKSAPQSRPATLATTTIAA